MDSDINMDVQKLCTDSSWMNCNHNYNNFFNPNICHVCKIEKRPLINCTNCHMITYCSNSHREVHFKQHQQFCAYITEYLKQNDNKGRRSETSEWIESRRTFLRVITQQFPRSLEPYEKQMIIFARKCCICHQQIKLTHCRKCYSVNYCESHRLDFKQNHNLKCKELRLRLNLDILYIIPVEFQQLITFPNGSEPFEDMNEFVFNCVHCSYRSLGHKQIITKFAYFCSDYVSGPFTLYDSMRKSQLLDLPNMVGPQFVIHVISANSIENKYVKAWELLQHVLCQIKELTVVLIGKELKTRNMNLESCDSCKCQNQKVKVVCRPGSYPEYRTDPTFQQPNVIIMFQAHFNKTTLWQEDSLLTSHRMKCPYILTAVSQSIAEENIKIIRKMLNINPKYDGPNNFKSLYPFRQLHTDCVGYRNSYVTIY
ncbi:uncharacterized protein LOC116844021 [Odontomachus brunneus]|uniref:uncharacterized protein LOC116844021 n=1 Tax=Odontomachus brunneus TaxID=486640 RepID=UPI0013F27C3C|nr:uncharacterized protein LOC116844021 [Odontomachus brunneus]XP_032670975.1 uncharacterized protein LOC116844021 [Odontomachus brunneus]XP_032670976.1 uncharacterized protein LOC116844021 [Odontomachus brunneus]XP_032670977.1 uncharacterized protein LOC116844021 [Odontomachus brunneus]